MGLVQAIVIPRKMADYLRQDHLKTVDENKLCLNESFHGLGHAKLGPIDEKNISW